MHPACPNKKQNHLQNSLLRRTQFWVPKTFSKPASLKRASLVLACHGPSARPTAPEVQEALKERHTQQRHRAEPHVWAAPHHQGGRLAPERPPKLKPQQKLPSVNS